METNPKLNLFAPAMAIVAVLALVIFVQTAFAVARCNPSINYATRVVQSCKQNYIVAGNVYWKGRVQSQVLNGGAITQLGWNSWTDTRYCAGIVAFFQDHGGSNGSNATNHASTSGNHTISSCPGGQLNESRVYGQHRWLQNGYSAYTETGWSLPDTALSAVCFTNTRGTENSRYLLYLSHYHVIFDC